MLIIQCLSENRRYVAWPRFYNGTVEAYALGFVPPRYPVPATIGFQTTQCGTYMFDTRVRMDGYPICNGYKIISLYPFTWKGIAYAKTIKR